MSQRAVEQVLGKLLTDEEFRRRFFEDPHCACVLSGFELSPVELEAVMRREPPWRRSVGASTTGSSGSACPRPQVQRNTRIESLH
jgi:hypothetical protein